MNAGAETTGSAERAVRIGLWWLLIAGWLVAVWMMLETPTTPSPGGQEASDAISVPTFRTFLAATAFSGLELAVLLALLWPWRPELYATRLAAAVLALVTWLIMIATPLDLTRMDWVHRRWLAGMVIAIVAALLVILTHRAVRRVTG